MNLDLHPDLQELAQLFAASPLLRLQDERLQRRKVELWVKRDDLLHPVISGNKWRKLKYPLDAALRRNTRYLASMGGPYSNHLHALAFAGKCLRIKTIGFVRGEEPASLNPTLRDLRQWGMELRFLSREAYRALRDSGQPALPSDSYWLPEGGHSQLAIRGVAESLTEIAIDFDMLVVACGTGTTLAGYISAAPVNSLIVGVAALKNAGFLYDDVQRLLHDRPAEQTADWEIILDYHFGGFARTTPDLLSFMRDFQARHSIELEPVYTGKLLYAVYDMVEKGCFRPGQRIIVCHTGGLQGNRCD